MHNKDRQIRMILILEIPMRMMYYNWSIIILGIGVE